MEFNIPGLSMTDEQRKAIEEQIKAKLAAETKALHDAYDAKAHWVRAWINEKAVEHSGVWVAQRVATATFLATLLFSGFVGWVVSVVSQFFKA